MFRKVCPDECRMEKIDKMIREREINKTYPPELWEHLDLSATGAINPTPLMAKLAAEVGITYEELVAWYKWNMENISRCGSI